MIKLILLDIDGVLLGSKKGINTPLPSEPVITYIAQLQDQGLPISLCTGKSSFAVMNIIKDMRLNNLHITDGGAVIIDPLTQNILKNSTIPSKVINDILLKSRDRKSLWSLFSLEHKYVQAGAFPLELQESATTMPWIEADDLLTVAANSPLTKAELIYSPEEEDYYREILSKYEENLSIQWTYAPNLLPRRIVIITAKNVNKHSSMLELIKYYQVPLDEVLAVGDTMMDWAFMNGCGYVATMGNANQEMQDTVKDYDGFVGGHVDDDGVIDILRHYRSQFSFSKQLPS